MKRVEFLNRLLREPRRRPRPLNVPGPGRVPKRLKPKGKVKHFIYSNIDKFSGNFAPGEAFPRRRCLQDDGSAQSAFHSTVQGTRPTDRTRTLTLPRNHQFTFFFFFFLKSTKKLLKCNFSIFLSKSIKRLRGAPPEEEEEPG